MSWDPNAPKLSPRVVGETAKYITIGWTPLPLCGYRFSIDGVVKSNTWDETVSQARFLKPTGRGTHTYEVEPISIGPGEKVVS